LKGKITVRHLGLKWKISVICLILVVGPLVTLGARVSYQVENYFLEEIRHALKAHAQLAVEVIQEEMTSGRRIDLTLFCRQLSETLEGEVCIVGPIGKRVADSIASHLTTLGRDSPQETSLRGGCGFCHPEVDVSEVVSTDAAFGKGPLEGHRVHVTASLYNVKRVVSKVRRMLLGTTVIAIIVSALLTLRLAAGVAQPITRMSKMAEVIAEGDFNQRLDSDRGDEVGRLAESLNRMSSKIQQMVTRLVDERNARRKFVADISHELRTPITALRTSVDALVDGAMDDTAVRDEFLMALDTQSDKLCALVNDLLNMSSIEAADQEEARICVPIREVVERVLGEVKSSADRKDVRLVVDVEKHICVLGDPRQIEVLIANLLDNAIKYNKQGGAVVVESRAEGDCVVITIADTGVGIDHKELSRIFERFYRPQSSRDPDHHGTGLGLAIAKEIVEAHGGRIHATSTPGKGASFTVTLPACLGPRSRPRLLRPDAEEPVLSLCDGDSAPY